MAAKRKRQQETAVLHLEQNKLSPRISKSIKPKSSIEKSKPFEEIPELGHNEGDTDFSPYLNPILEENNFEMRSILAQQLVTPVFGPSEELMESIGFKMWACFNSDVWRHRDSSAQALNKFIKDIDNTRIKSNQDLQSRIVRSTL